MVLLCLAASFMLLAASNLYALVWSEGSYADFSDGLFNKSTCTAVDPRINTLSISDWYTVANSTWQNRKPIRLFYASEVIEHQTKLDFGVRIRDYISSGKIRADGADIRFSDSDGKTLIPFWIDVDTAALATCTTTQVWVKIPHANANEYKTIYMYYNNPDTATFMGNRYAVEDFYEDWNSGVIDTSKWTLSGDANFQITSSSKYEGGYSVRSGPIVDGQDSSLANIPFSLSADGVVTFKWASSCEGVRTNDYMPFYLNGSEIPPQFNRIFGEMSWWTQSAGLAAGSVSLSWVYHKNGSISEGLDRCWIDQIIVRKAAPQPTTADFNESEELYTQLIYSRSDYSSQVLDTGAENTLLLKGTWTYEATGGSLNIYVRQGNTAFQKEDPDGVTGVSLWTGIAHGANLGYMGRYVQYKTELNSNAAGTTAPSLVHMAVHFESPPKRPNKFRGLQYSSSTICWEWNDLSANELGFRVYSDTGPFSTALISSSNLTGLVAQLGADVTYYIETNLIPNVEYNRFVVAYSTAGANAAYIYVSSGVAGYPIATFAQPPQINSERGYISNPVTDAISYEPILKESYTTSSTFYFTSNIYSTGPARVHQYRYVWDDNPTHTWLNTETLWYAPTNFIFNDVTGSTLSAKPQLTQWLSFNTTNAYFHVQSYNFQGAASGSIDLGPYYFNGCPSQITDLVVSSFTATEGSIRLSWTAPFANSTFTSISNGQYILKYGPTLINNESAFDSAPNTLLISTSTAAGEPQTLLITGLSPGSFYGFAIKTVDSDNNYSPLSTNLSNALYTRTSASKTAKIVFKNVPLTTYVGLPTAVITVECQDSCGNPINLAENEQILLKRDGDTVTSTDRGFSESDSSWSSTFLVTILKGLKSAQFYYKDDTAGLHTMNVSNANSGKGWTDASQSVNVLPGKAVTFVMPGLATSQVIKTPVVVSVHANDGYNPANTSQDYIGRVISTVSVPNSALTPAATTFTAGDLGVKSFLWQNNDYAGSGTFSIAEDNPQSFNDIRFANNQSAYMPANLGMIKRTVDSGEKWFSVNSTGTGVNVRSVAFDQSNNYVLGAANSGLVVVSTDATQSFRTFDTGIAVNLYGIYFVDISTVYACGDNGRIIKSTDYGITWSANIGPGGEANRFNSIYFINASTGFACANGGNVWKTTDGGANWASASPGGAVNLLRIQFVDASNGFISASGGKVFRTTNAGTSWDDVSPAGVTVDIKGMHFIDSNTGVIAGNDRTIYKTSALGPPNWVQIISTAAVNLNAVSFAKDDPNVILAAGDSGLIYRSINGGNSWSQVTMSGQSASINWNGLTVNAGGIPLELLQGRARQATVKLTARQMFGGTSPMTQFRVYLSGGTGAYTDIQYVSLFRDGNNDGIFNETNAYRLGSPVTFNASGEAAISGFTYNITNQATFFMVLDIPQTATLNTTLGFQIRDDCLSVSGIPLAKNGLPITIPPMEIVPSSCTLNINVSDLSNLTYTEVQQGQTDIFISSFAMITDRSNTNFRRLVIRRDGINNTDASIDNLKLWQGPTSVWTDRNPTPVSTATFVSGLANLNISTQTWGTDIIDSMTTQYFFLTVDVAPTAIPYTDTTDARFWLSFGMTTSYFLLDPGGANGITSNIGSYESNHFRIKAAFDTLLMDANNMPPAVSIDQSLTVSFIPLKLQRAETGGSINWTRLNVTQIGTATDADISKISIFRDSNGDNTLQPSSDAELGSAVPSGGSASITLTNPENLTDTLTNFATFFIAVTASKRATAGNTVQITISSQNFTMAGTDLVTGNTLTSPSAIINNYLDPVSVDIQDLTPSEVRIDETNLPMAKITLWAYCSAVLTKVAPEIAGTAAYTDVSLIKIYADADSNGEFSSTNDTLLGSGPFGADGKSSINLTTTPTIYDSSYTVFLVYDFNANGTPLTTAGFGLSDSQDTLSFPGETGAAGKFGYFVSRKIKLLHKETPSVPVLSLSIGIPGGKKVGANTVYYSNDPSQLIFNSVSSALNGVAQIKYALATFSITSTTDTPDVTSWLSTDISTGTFVNMNLQHNTVYYLWCKAVSTDGYERATSVMMKVDLTSPDKPSIPTDTSAKAKSASAFMASMTATEKAAALTSSFWVNWPAAVDGESGIALYEIQERADTSPLWVSIATTTVNQYMVSKDTYTDQGKFFYYRVRAQNFAGTWSDYSDASSAAYLSLPPDLIKDIASYPNPFDSRIKSATLTFVLNQAADIEFRIYDLLGGKVKEWKYTGQMGPNNLTWDGTDEYGNKVAAGMYILTLDVTAASETQKKRWKIGVIH